MNYIIIRNNTAYNNSIVQTRTNVRK